MKILYAIQGTGNGHVSRAGALLSVLRTHAEVDVLVSGQQSEIDPGYPVQYRFQGLGFIFGKKGGIDLMATYRRNRLRTFRKEVAALPVENYDLVISDFEPVSVWACAGKGIPCVGLSHQAAVLHEEAPQPLAGGKVGRAFLRYYAPVQFPYGFHFQAYAKGIFTPVIREGVRAAKVSEEEHYTVYLPAYSIARITEVLSQIPDTNWEVFTRHTTVWNNTGNIFVQPINDRNFLQSMASAQGVLCGAGFETPAEALFLGKKLMVIPMKGQYEQQCNATALEAMGVPVLPSLKHKHIARIESWIAEEECVQINYPDQTAEVVATILRDHEERTASREMPELRPRKFRKSAFQKIIARYLRD